MQARTKKACFQLARLGLFPAKLRLFFHIWKCFRQYYKALPENGAMVSLLHKSRFKKRTAGLSAHRACPGKEGKYRQLFPIFFPGPWQPWMHRKEGKRIRFFFMCKAGNIRLNRQNAKNVIGTGIIPYRRFPLVSHNRMKQRLHIHCRYVTKDRPDGWRRRKSVIKKMFHCE